MNTPKILKALEELSEELGGMYDGAPDSNTLWMGSHMLALEGVIAAIRQDSLDRNSVVALKALEMARDWVNPQVVLSDFLAKYQIYVLSEGEECEDNIRTKLKRALDAAIAELRGEVKPTPLPCPFCGGEAFIRTFDDGWFAVACVCASRLTKECACNCSTITFSTREAAIAAWNTRADVNA